MKVFRCLPDKMTADRFVGLDIEVFGQTDGKLHRPNGTFACISVCIEGSDDVYQIYDTKQLDKLFIRIENGTWVFHNSLYDLRQLQRYTKIESRFIWDTMLVSQTMYGGYYRNHRLQHLVRRDLGIVMSKDIRKDFSTLTKMTKEMKEYAALDALYTVKLAVKQKEKFHDDPAFKAYLNIDEPMIWPVLDMPGICVDSDNWRRMADEFVQKAKSVEQELGINTMSPAQVKLFLSEQGIHVKSTGKEILEGFPDNEDIQNILLARMYRKAVSTYGIRWLDTNVEDDGKVYSSYNVTGAKSGRMSSSYPNMQQIPARKLPQYRDLFVASPGNVMLIWDVAQQEPCITAYESQDSELLRATSNKEDLHLTVARAIFDDDTLTKEKNKEKRNVGKTINLGTSYGLSEYGLDRKLNCGLDTAKDFLHKYFLRFKGVFNWIAYTRQQAARQGYVTTAAGRKIYINLHSKGWQNLAINSPIQGGAADFTKMWVRNIWERCKEAGLKYTLNLIVHDEIGMDVPKELQSEYEKIISDAFNYTAVTMFPGILFRADGESGRTWSCKV